MTQRPPRHFIFGADLDDATPEAVKELFYETGLNCARLTGGGFGWSVAAHKALADAFAARGLQVYLQLGSHYPDADYFKLDGARMADQDGVGGVEDKTAWAISYSGQFWPQYSYNSLPFREKLTRDFTSYVAHFNDRKNITGVILHNEPGFFWMSERIFDYSAATLAAYRKWLEEQHHTVAALNERWGTKYQSFAEVVPPGKPPVPNVAAWLDWRRFSIGAVAGFMRWEAGLFKTLRSDVPRTTNLDGPLNSWYAYRGANVFEYSEAMDRVGMDIYPTQYTNRDFLPYSSDLLVGTAQGREAHVLESEIFSGTIWNGYDESQRAGLVASEVWTMIGHGIDGILLWGFHHGDGYSITDGTFNARVRACRDIAFQGKMIGLDNFHRTPARVALCVDTDTYLLGSSSEPTPRDLEVALDEEYGGFHAALADAGIPVDVLIVDQLRTDAWKNYGAIILPSATMMDADLAARLKTFVSGGGTLIACAPFARMDRWAKGQAVVPAFGLDEVFGVSVNGGVPAAQGEEITSGDKKISAQHAVPGLVLHGAQASGSFGGGQPAVTMHPFGRGKAVFIAAEVGRAYLGKWSGQGLSGFLADSLQAASVVPVATAQADVTVDASSIVDPQGNALLVFSVLGAKAKLPTPAHEVAATYRTTTPAAYRMGFVFPPTRNEGTVVRSGPVPLALTPSADGKSVSFHLPEVDSSLPVLLVKDGTPLLQVEGPQEVARDSAGEIKITCYNPSAKPIQGKLELRARSIAPGEKAMEIDVPAEDRKTVTLHFTAAREAAGGRLPVQVALVQSGTAAEIISVPIDVELK